MNSVSSVTAESRRTHLERRLLEIQGARSDKEFAAWLGIERTYWSRIRRGKRSLSKALIEKAIAKDESLLSFYMRDLMPTERSA